MVINDPTTIGAAFGSAEISVAVFVAMISNTQMRGLMQEIDEVVGVLGGLQRICGGGSHHSNAPQVPVTLHSSVLEEWRERLPRTRLGSKDRKDRFKPLKRVIPSYPFQALPVTILLALQQ